MARQKVRLPFNRFAACYLGACTLAATQAVAQTNAPVPLDGDLSTPYRAEIVASRLQAPWSVVFASDGRIFFSERPGWVRVIEHDRVLPEPALILRDVVASVKMGALGLALDPGFATNHLVYLAYNYDLGKEQYRLRIVRYHEATNHFSQPHTLLEDIPAYRNHTGCRLRFGPDGCLYITTGDANQPPLAQRLDSFAGKILRLQPDGSIPRDNPFAGRTNALGAIWSYGHRNSQGLDFQPGTGALFASEHGPDNGDEINLVIKGENYGWPLIHHRQSKEGLRSPILEFTPSVAPSGVCFYRGTAFPELEGKLLVGCLRGEGILRIGFEGTNPIACDRLLHFKYGRIRDVTEGPDGYIYFTTSQFDPPEGTPRPDYDMILRLVPKSAASTGAVLASEWKGPPPQSQNINPATTNASQLITLYCAPCHGPSLRGGMQRGLLYGHWEFAKDDAGVQQVINKGLADRGMPAFGATLKAEQVTSLLRYIRQNQTTGPEPALESRKPSGFE
ncbi:MAG: glucose sorbosone dehydrogenase [Verrucomicrobia bacterium]|nr:MAG: glucose sorbosone dehydrogenase [Verrucomicrobiota bacterium]